MKNKKVPMAVANWIGSIAEYTYKKLFEFRKFCKNRYLFLLQITSQLCTALIKELSAFYKMFLGVIILFLDV